MFFQGDDANMAFPRINQLPNFMTVGGQRVWKSFDMTHFRLTHTQNSTLAFLNFPYRNAVWLLATKTRRLLQLQFCGLRHELLNPLALCAKGCSLLRCTKKMTSPSKRLHFSSLSYKRRASFEVSCSECFRRPVRGYDSQLGADPHSWGSRR